MEDALVQSTNTVSQLTRKVLNREQKAFVIRCDGSKYTKITKKQQKQNKFRIGWAAVGGIVKGNLLAPLGDKVLAEQQESMGMCGDFKFAELKGAQTAIGLAELAVDAGIDYVQVQTDSKKLTDALKGARGWFDGTDGASEASQTEGAVPAAAAAARTSGVAQ